MMKNQKKIKQVGVQLKYFLKCKLFLQKWKKWKTKSQQKLWKVNQIIKTQLIYHNNLLIIKQILIPQLIKYKIIQEKHIQHYFKNIQIMIDTSQYIVASMGQKLMFWNTNLTQITKQMVQISLYFIVYADFLQNYPKLQLILNDLKHNKNSIYKQIQKSLGQKQQIQILLSNFQNRMQNKKQKFRLNSSQWDKICESIIKQENVTRQLNNKNNQQQKRKCQSKGQIYQIKISSKQIFISDLISVPFHRLPKYNLFFQDFYKNLLYRQHKTIHKCKQAIVKIRQNINKVQRDQVIFKDKIAWLERIFKDITSQSTHYISQFQAQILENKVKCYLLTDRLLISCKSQQGQQQYIRIFLTENSFIINLRDRIYIQNSVIVCGNIGVLLTFTDRIQKQLNKQNIQSAILNIYRNKQQRKLYTNTPYLEHQRHISSKQYRQSSYLNKKSIQNIQSQIDKPPRIQIIGYTKRYFSSKFIKEYYIIKFTLSEMNNHQLLYLQRQKLNKIQIYLNQSNKNITQITQNNIIKDLKNLLVKETSTDKKLQFNAVYFTLLLNNIFMNQIIRKKIDIFAYFLQISQCLWKYMKSKLKICSKQCCIDLITISKYSQYLKDKKQRITSQKYEKAVICPLHTINVQNSVAQKNLSKLNQIDRLSCYKYNIKGQLDYSLSAEPNCIFQKSQKIQIQIPKQKSDKMMKYEFILTENIRVGTVKAKLQNILGQNLIQYVICMRINKKLFVLSDDQNIYNLMKYRQTQQTGLTSYFMKKIYGSQDMKINFMLRRVWWMVEQQQQTDYIKSKQLRMSMFIRQLYLKIKYNQIFLPIKNLIMFYACYLVYNQIKSSQINEEYVQYLFSELFLQNEDLNMKKLMLKALRQKTKDIYQNVKIQNQADMKIKMFTYIYRIFKQKNLNTISLFKGQIVHHYKIKQSSPVSIAFNHQYFKIIYSQDGSEFTNIIKFHISDIFNKIVFTFYQIIILSDEENPIIIKGYNFLQLQIMLRQYIDFYKININARDSKPDQK